MTWVKTSDDFHQRPALAMCSRTARLLHHEALTYSNANNLGGVIPRALMRRITDEDDYESAAAELVEQGAWAARAAGWQLIDSIDEQPSQEEIERQKAFARARQRRRRMHTTGDHSECQPKHCPYVTRDIRRESHPGHDTPSRPAPTRPDRRERDGEEGADPTAAGASPDHAADAQARLGRTPHSWTGDCCPLPPNNPIHTTPEQETAR